MGLCSGFGDFGSSSVLTEAFSLTSLQIQFTFWHFALHLVVGQIAGYILLWLMRGADFIGEANPWLVGIIYGVVFCVVSFSIGTTLGAIRSPLETGTSTVIWGMVGWASFGVIAALTTKNAKAVRT